MLRELNLCGGKYRGYRALMGGMLRRVVGLGVVCVCVLAAPSLASAAVNGSVAGWRSPAAGHMDLTVQATPDGANLRSAAVTLGSLMVTESFADGSCSQTCPATLTLGVNTHDAFGQDFVGDRDLVVTVEDVNGEFELKNVNGGVRLVRAGGNGTINTVNGDVEATFARAPSAATSFHTVNGDLDVTFPASLAAELVWPTRSSSSRIAA